MKDKDKSGQKVPENNFKVTFSLVFVACVLWLMLLIIFAIMSYRNVGSRRGFFGYPGNRFVYRDSKVLNAVKI